MMIQILAITSPAWIGLFLIAVVEAAFWVWNRRLILNSGDA